MSCFLCPLAQQRLLMNVVRNLFESSLFSSLPFETARIQYVHVDSACPADHGNNPCVVVFLAALSFQEIPHCVPEPPSSRYLPTIVARMIISELKQDEHCKGIDLLAELARIGTASLEYIVAG